MRTQILALVTAILAHSALSGCAGQTASPALDPGITNCPAQTVEIRVGDGFLQHDCGCSNMVNGTIVPQGTALVCTGPSAASVPVTVFFTYSGSFTIHQILATGTPTFPPSAISNPLDKVNRVMAHAVSITVSGGYGFVDQFNTQVFGTINL